MITIDELKNKITNKSRLLGLDLGSKRIGVAICDERQSIATPFATIKKEGLDRLINELKLIVQENNIKAIVVGNPVNMDGKSGKSSQSTNDFAKNLSRNVTIPISFWDERLSTEASFNITKELGTNVTNRVNKLDENSATFILQGAIDYLSN